MFDNHFPTWCSSLRSLCCFKLWASCGSILRAAMSEEPEEKRPRLTPEPTAGTRYKLQSLAVKPSGELWPAHDITLTNGGLVIVDNKAAHGSWFWDREKTELHVSYHWNAEESKAKKCTCVRIPETNCFVQVGCDAEWRCVLAPLQVAYMTPEERMAYFWVPF